ncbi:MAG: non-canonical purine NTP diphosphatase [Alloprevotella sp.]|nr:non-canonical purine NTP diphosphatase [Prevotellamassilia sp.]MDY5762974.1 non-canonical purine NTP diphosphatase [Alloprevotella sp.]MDY6114208.1 non-canonical purine NTP diphosphatase [Alloprevotella sp.]
MKRLVFATNNAHKLSEVRAMVGDTFEILSLEDLDCHDDIPETADTLSGNALMKAEYIAEKYHVNCFADDTGLVVDALGGAPGVHTARYAFPDRHDPVANTKKLLAELQGQPDRRAAFITAIALIIDGQKHLFEGRVDGFIATEERGSEGFGYDPVFIPEDTGKTFAELGVDAKNKISHRARAIAKLCTFLKGKPAAC